MPIRLSWIAPLQISNLFPSFIDLSDKATREILLVVVLGVLLILFLVTIATYQSIDRWRRGIKSVSELFGRFLGQDLKDFHAHEKRFPGYDLASLHRSIESFFEELCLKTPNALGSPHGFLLSNLLEHVRLSPAQKIDFNLLAFERFPVDVDREESFSTNPLWLAEMHGVEGSVPQKLIIQLFVTQANIENDFAGDRAVGRIIVLTIACSSRHLADRFFKEIEQRRRTHSIFRGKVIDPQFAGYEIQSIAFRSIKQVDEQDLILTESVKELIQGTILNYYRQLPTLKKLGIELKRGILFHSLPGTGKTSISLYLARILPEFTVCFVSGQRLLYPRELCRMARYLQPTMIVFEDIDLIAEHRDSNGLATVLGELMNQIDGCDVNDQVLFIMNTNSLSRLEEAVRNRPGRIDQIIDIPLPDAQTRRRLLLHFANGIGLEGTQENAVDNHLSRIIAATDGMTPAMLKEIVKRATVIAVTRFQDENHTTDLNPSSIIVTENELLLAAKQVQAMRSDKQTSSSNLGFR